MRHNAAIRLPRAHAGLRTGPAARATPRETGQLGCLAFRRHEYEREGESATCDDDESQTLEKVVLAIGLEDREAEDCPVRGDQGELDSQPRKERQRKVVDDHRGQSDPGESNHRAIEDATTGTALVQALRPLHEHKESVTIGDAYYTDEARLACTRTSCW